MSTPTAPASTTRAPSGAQERDDQEPDDQRPDDQRPDDRTPAGPVDKSPRASLPRGAGWWSWIGAAVAFGAALRFFRLGWQLPFGDELHAVRVVAAHPLRTIVTTWFETDPSPPLAALDELLVLLGVELDETVLRLPSLLSGLAALVVLPLLVRARSPRLAVTLAWLLALSPGLVLYSRIARPYMAVAFLGCVSTFAFLAWWRRPAASSAALYLASAVLTLWLFIGAAPFVTAPFAFAALLKLLRAREGPRWRDIAGLGVLLLLGIALFLVPSRESFAELLRGKSGGSDLRVSSLLDTLQLLAGTRTAPPAVLFWVLVVAGWTATLKRDAPFALLSALAAIAQVVAMGVLAPLGLANAVVLERYLLVALPILLFWVAGGIVELADRSRRRVGSVAGSVAATVPLLALFLAGPFTDRGWLSTSFQASEEYVGFHAARSYLPPESVPEIYRRLAEAAGDEAIIEYTGSPSWNHLNHLTAYQEIHRRPVLFAPEDDEALFAPGIALRRLLPPNGASFLAAPARYVIVHRHTARELDRLLRPDALGLPPFGRDLRSRARLRAERMARRLERRWGSPTYADDDVVAWDLDAVRAGRATSAGARPQQEPVAVPRPGGQQP